jgi:poly(A) polymerase Pap1
MSRLSHPHQLRKESRIGELARHLRICCQAKEGRSGTVESRIRTLVQDLENTDNILTAHPQVGGVSNTFICLTEEEQAAASQGELSVEAMKRKEEDFEGKEYKKIYTKNFFIGLEIEKKPSELGTPSAHRSAHRVDKMDDFGRGRS